MEMADVTIHIDEAVDHERRTRIADMVRARKGVASVCHHDEKPHLMIVEFDPDRVTSRDLLQIILGQGIHGELIGL